MHISPPGSHHRRNILRTRVCRYILHLCRRCRQWRILRGTIGSDSQGGISEKTYRIYHPGETRGRLVHAATSHFAGVNFPIHGPRLFARQWKMALLLFDLFLRTHLDNSPDRKRREIFLERGCHEYRRRRQRRSRRVLRIGQCLVYYSFTARQKRAEERRRESLRRLLRM